MTVQEWVQARIADLDAREGVMSLVTVGPDKPLGSYGFSSVEEARAAIDAVPLPPKEFVIFPTDTGVWAYLWDVVALPRLLSRWGGLGSSGPREFVEFIRANQVPPFSRPYDFIADAYGDKLNPGRTGTTLAIPKLKAFKRVTGHVDPSTIYFASAGYKEARRLMPRR